MAGSKKYPDLRYLFIRGLIQHEGEQRCHHYLKSSGECTSRAIVSLELADTPVKSVKQARQLEGIGGETCRRLTKLDKEKEFSCLKPLGGRFTSSAGGILVGLLDATEEIQYKENCSPDKTVLVPEDSVKSRAIRLTEEQFANVPNEFCKAWWRLEVLIKRGYVRRRSQKKLPVLQLMPIGKDIALRLRAQNGMTSTVPDKNKIPDPYGYVARLPTSSSPRETHLTGGTTLLQSLAGENTLRQSLTGETNPLQHKPELEDALYTNDTGQDNVVMLVDRREMGGEKYGLGELCRMLDNKGICYKTKHLKTGDYSWIWRVNNKEIILPCLAERKRADDIVHTLLEGRFWAQVNKMKGWKKEFTERGIQSAIHYILERKPEEFVVKCEDGCQGIIKCGNPSLTQVKMVIEDLKKHPDLLVKETDNLNITVILLASLTAELKERVKKGDFDQLLRLEKSEKKSLPSQTEKLPAKDLYVDILYVPLETPVSTNTLPSDLCFEDEMNLAIEMSKSMMKTKQNGCAEDKKETGNIVVINDDNHHHTSLNHDDDKDPVEIDNDDDNEFFNAELALVLERSKYDTHMEIGVSDCAEGGVIPEIRPLMQYHCSEGGSLNFPSGKSSESPSNMYRPKRQVVQTVSSPQQGGNDTSNSKTLNQMPLNGASKTLTKSLNEYSGYKENSKKLSISRTNARDFQSKRTLNQEANRHDKIIDALDVPNILHYDKNAKAKKRKPRNKEIVFQADEHCVEESNISGSAITPKKKQRVPEFNFTPSKECVEINVIQTTVSGNLKNKNNKRKGGRSSGRKSSKVSANVEDGATQAANEESNVCGTLNMEFKDENKKCNEIEDKSSNLENVERKENEEYDSDVDIFADNSFETERNGSFSVDTKKSDEDCDISSFGNRKSDGDDSLPDIDSGNEFHDQLTIINVNTPNVCDRELENKVELVMSVLPHVGKHSIREMLKQFNNNVDLCVTQLLEKNP